MTELEVKKWLEGCRKKIHTLRKTRATNRATSQLLLGRVRDLEDDLRTMDQRTASEKEEFTNDALLIGEAVTQMLEYNQRKWARFSDLFAEIFERLFGYRKSMDFFAIESPLKVKGLRCDFRDELGETSFILFASPLCDFQNKDLLGLVAHEIAHMYPEISRFADSVKPRLAKKGEALADFLGLNLVGPAFAHAASCYVIDIVTPAESTRESLRHPTWACRLSILRHTNKDLWENTTIENWVEAHLSRLDDFGVTVPPTENMLHSRCVREADGLRGSFASFKMSEGRLMSIAEDGPSEMSNMTLALNVHARKKVMP